jgi:hypothetical protein
VKRWRIAFSDAELLRTAPVLWSLNLHRLPSRLLPFVVGVAILALALWSRPPNIDPLLVALIGQIVAWIGVGAIVARYRGVPSDEFIPTPPAVHWQALTARFLVFVPVMLAPLLLGEIVAHGIAATPKLQLVSDINDINVGAHACCALSRTAPACFQRRFIPREPREAEQILARGLPLLADHAARAKAQSCHASIACLTTLTVRFESAIMKYQNAKNLGPLGSHDDEKEDPVDPGTEGEPVLALPLSCRRVQHRHFADAAANLQTTLTIGGVIGSGEPAIPLRFYGDALQWSAWLSLLAAMDTLAVAALAAAVTLFLPLLAGLVPVACWSLMFLMSGTPQIPDAEIQAWFESHIVGVVEGYFALCGIAYLAAAWRLVRRPADADRAQSLGFFTAFPLLVLGLTEFVGLSKHWRVIGETSLRTFSLVLLVAYLALSGWLRREGVKIRALPRPASAQASKERRWPRDPG